jgi:hypothetical protein
MCTRPRSSNTFGGEIDNTQLRKAYGQPGGEGRYSPDVHRRRDLRLRRSERVLVEPDRRSVIHDGLESGSWQ